MFENELTPVDFSTAELGAAWLAVLDRVMADLAVAENKLREKQAEIYVAPDERAKAELEIATQVRRLQDDLIALGLCLEEARRNRATAGVGR